MNELIHCCSNGREAAINDCAEIEGKTYSLSTVFRAIDFLIYIDKFHPGESEVELPLKFAKFCPDIFFTIFQFCSF